MKYAGSCIICCDDDCPGCDDGNDISELGIECDNCNEPIKNGLDLLTDGGDTYCAACYNSITKGEIMTTNLKIFEANKSIELLQRVIAKIGLKRAKECTICLHHRKNTCNMLEKRECRFSLDKDAATELLKQGR